MSVAKSNKTQENNAISSDKIVEIFGEESNNNPKPPGRILHCYNGGATCYASRLEPTRHFISASNYNVVMWGSSQRCASILSSENN